jgi:N-methylhydantoinase B
LRNIGSSPIHLSIIPDKIVCAPPGLNGGQPGKLGQVYLAGERLTRFPPLTLEPGADLELLMPGGAGFGPPHERERELVLRDLAMGYISADGARREYGLELVAPDGSPAAQVEDGPPHN